MHRRLWLAGCVGVVLTALAAAVALAGTVISGSVVRQADGGPVQGAIVTVAGPQQPPLTQLTGAGGEYSIDAPGSGPYSVGVSAAGFASGSLGGVPGGALQPFSLRPAVFTPLPVFGGSPSEVAADARSGIFYALMGGAPELYRTLDHGGSWQSVTMAYDSPDTGLRRPQGSDILAVSGVSGEVAVLTAGGEAHFSTDYGLTWQTLGGDALTGLSNVGGAQRLLFWAHAGTDNVLMAALAEPGGAWQVARADMSAASPAFVREPSDPFGAGSVLAVAESVGGAFVGRVSAGGALSFAPLDATGPIAFGADEAAGLPSPPYFLRLGGAAEAAAPPDGALVVGGGGPYQAQLLTKDAGAAGFAGGSASAVTELSGDCQVGEAYTLRAGSVAPTSTGAVGAGNAGLCWLQKDGTGPLTVTGLCCAPSDVAYDANWGAGNRVAFMAQPDGPHKAARHDDGGTPNFNPLPEEPGGATLPASGGTGPDSGGLSVEGIVSATVNDTEYGPAGAQDVAVAVPSAQLMLASKNGGATFTPLVQRGQGANAVQWWPGTGGDWLVFGNAQGGPHARLTAVRNWDGASTPGESASVAGSTPADLGGGSLEGYGVTALAGVPGTDTVLIGLGFGSDPDITGDNHLYRGRLVDGAPPSLTDRVSFDSALGGIPLYLPQAFEYCPASAANAGMRDALFVATGDGTGDIAPGDSKGSLLRIAGATGATPAATQVGSVPHDAANTIVFDVRADCDAGVVYAGGTQGLYKSTDGGQTFVRIEVPVPAPTLQVTAIGLNPADPNDVTIGTFLGTVLHSSDGGTTWTLVNDPAYQREGQVNDIEIPPSGGQARASVRVAAASGTARSLVGTGGGAYRADLAAGNGIIGLSTAAGGLLGAQLTNVGSDATPVLAVDPAGGGATAVFARSDGLAYASRAGGSWSLPRTLPGTAPRDREPSLARGSSGALVLAFRRPGGAAPGIYVAARAADGAWSPPQRLSTSRRDRLPSVALTSGRRATAHVAFVRGRGRRAGIHHAWWRGGRWRSAKVKGTGRADAKPAAGGPSLAPGRRGRAHLAFARVRGKRGIYYAASGRRRFRRPQRLTTVRGDREPALAVGRDGAKQLVFRRTAGTGREGLFALTGKRKWKLRPIPGTAAADTQLELTVDGATARLVFARPVAPAAGIYLGSRRGTRRWREAPVRVSTGLADRNPALRADAAGAVTLVFERE